MINQSSVSVMPLLIDGTISPDEYWQLFARGWVVDGRAGGYVLGRRHADGGVPLIAPTYRIPFEFEFCGCMEGAEYLVAKQAAEAFGAEVEALNKTRPSDGLPVAIGATDRVIDARAQPHDRFVIIDRGSQFIVNFDATRKHYSRLAEINQTSSPTQDRVFCDEVIELLKGLGPR